MSKTEQGFRLLRCISVTRSDQRAKQLTLPFGRKVHYPLWASEMVHQGDLYKVIFIGHSLNILFKTFQREKYLLPQLYLCNHLKRVIFCVHGWDSISYQITKVKNYLLHSIGFDEFAIEHVVCLHYTYLTLKELRLNYWA